jgi:hypothetical protein
MLAGLAGRGVVAMPRPPGLEGKINFVVEMWNNPCDAPWYVYVETAWPAALQMVVTVFCFDFDDLVRWIFRPMGLWPMGFGIRRRGRRGGRRRRGLGARVRSKLPYLVAIEGRQVSNGVKNLWRIDTIGQKLLWWWLLIDATTTFAYNWTSAIYKTEWCQLKKATGAGAAEGDSSIYGGLFPPLTIMTPNIQYNRGTVLVTAYAIHIEEGTYQITGALEGIASTSTGSYAQLYVNVVGGPKPYSKQVDAARMIDGQRVSLVASVHAEGPALVFILCGTSGGWVTDAFTVKLASGVTPIPPPDNYACWMQGLWDSDNPPPWVPQD